MKSFLFCVILLSLLSFSIQAQEAVPTSQPFKENTIGAGIGIPYGVIGINADINIAPNLNLTGGIGYAIVGVGYNFGAKYFFSDVSKSFRPRVLAVYGTNAYLQVIGASSYDKAYTGLSLGVGGQWMWGKSRTNGVDFDIIFIATTGLDVNDLKNQGIIAEEPGKIKISIGYRHTL
jgi:opacity protein-like surface antigen